MSPLDSHTTSSPSMPPPAGEGLEKLPIAPAIHALGGLHFELPGNAHALFTDRSTGNLSTFRGTNHERGEATRESLCESLSLRYLSAGRQVHGKEVHRLSSLDDDDAAADGRATSLPGAGVMVLTADCLPVIVATEGVVAALHAGWRGLAAGVLEEGVTAVRELVAERGPRAGARTRARGPARASEGLVAVVGPSAGVCCYEVGPEVHELFAGEQLPHLHGPQNPVPRSEESHRISPNLDLKAIARHRLLRAGVQRVETVELCTICHQRFFSHRREGLQAGRQAGIAWLS